MKIKLETLQHQTDALAAIDKSFPGMDTMSNDPNANYIYANPLIKYRYNDKALTLKWKQVRERPMFIPG